MTYLLNLSTRANPQAFSRGYATRDEAVSAVQRAIDKRYLIDGDFGCTLGPGCILRLVSEVAESLPEMPMIGATHHVVITMHGRNFVLDFTSPDAMRSMFETILQDGVFTQSFKGGEDVVYVYLEPGTTVVQLTAEVYQSLSGEKPKQSVLLS